MPPNRQQLLSYLSAPAKHTIDKSEWAPGPWRSEPDYSYFKKAGMYCCLLRMPITGTWCGYVVGAHESQPKDDLVVHGGITYDHKCAENDPRCLDCSRDGHHVHGLRVVGFDCNHYHDYAPARHLEDDVWLYNPGATSADYRTFEFAKKELQLLALQVSEYLKMQRDKAYLEAR